MKNPRIFYICFVICGLLKKTVTPCSLRQSPVPPNTFLQTLLQCEELEPDAKL